jgi:hypothetical protein
MKECPRCLHLIPNDRRPGQYDGEFSCIGDNEIEICTACYVHERELMKEGRVIPRALWPVEIPVGLLNECPRCWHQIPDDRQPGAHPGPLSSIGSDRWQFEICEACGRHEAALLSSKQVYVRAQWPVEVPPEFYA